MALVFASKTHASTSRRDLCERSRTGLEIIAAAAAAHDHLVAILHSQFDLC
jgi:hypothetical protein